MQSYAGELTPMLAAPVTLNDKYALESGRAFMTGIQALVRLPLMQRRRDRAAGLNTAGFISGYRGSPLGTLDQALRGAKKFLETENIIFLPGVNEDLAATSVWGSQQVGLFPGARFDGVFGMWYGKMPGVDRSLDAIRHGNSAGTSRYGGVLLLLGDDHGARSSTLAGQSEEVMAAAMMPVLHPATVQEYLDFGVLGFALSRFAGCWVGMKTITETVESSATVSVDPDRVKIVMPDDSWFPAGGLGIRWPENPRDMESRQHGPKMAAIAAFSRQNPFDREVWAAPRVRIGIVTCGKAHLDVLQALADLGIDRVRGQALGVSIYKVGLVWPLEQEGLRKFAVGLEELIVVEEKRGMVEDQIVKTLYNLDSRPVVVGKFDESGKPLFPSVGELNSVGVASVLGNRLLKRIDDPILRQRLAAIDDLLRMPATSPLSLTRTPFFCSGCPHNTSTKLPEGSRAGAGIGCHGMATFVPEMRTSTLTHMGGEGANWIGQAPFTNEAHVFQNLGDGTYYHSGLLAIRAAAAARVNITYKILFNDAIAMTGGQPHDGPLDPALISRQVAAEGARKIVIVTDEPDKYPAQVDFAPGTTVRPRADLDAVQRELRQVPGLTVLIYDQTCAAEKRRRRKRGLYPDPPKRAFINDRVCEGCGDCSEKSRCVAVKPLETEFGRKRQIDQSDCNKDFSCINGFCPSFVTVHGSGLLKRTAEPAASGGTDTDAPLPEPALPEIHGSYHILVTGIGGTGVITVGAIIGMAAHIEGKSCSVLDSTGLAQKNGAVMSHICLAARDDERHAVRIARGGADALIGCDIVVAASDEAVSRLNPRSGRAVVNEHVQPTSDFIRNADLRFDSPDLLQAIEQAASGKVETVDATGLATSLMGDAMATNLFMLGYAWQKGVIPLSMASLISAMELNGVAVDVNKRTFAWGRRAAVDLVDVIAAATPKRNPPPVPMTLDAVIEHRADELVRYQNAAYADRYRALVVATDQADEAPGREFSMAVARNLYKLMAYKDEYEVARLFSDGEFRRKLSRQFAPGYKLEFHLAPPLLAKRDPVTQELKKRSYGSWLLPAFGLLARAKVLRGTWADPFGYTRERRLERQLVIDYEAMIRKIAGRLTADNREIAIKLAEIPQLIRGYGHVKDRHLTAALKQRDALLQEFERVNSGQISRGSAEPSARAVSSG